MSFQINETPLLFPTTVDPASASPYLLSSFGEFAAAVLRVALRPVYRHLTARLLLCLLLLLVPRCHGFIVRPACIIQGHLANSFKNRSLRPTQAAQRVSFR